MKKSIATAVIKDVGPILRRNILSLVVIIIGGLSLLLMYLGDTRDGAFLGGVIVINIIVGIVQEFRSRIALERLQATAAELYSVSCAGEEVKKYSEEIELGDIVYLKLGDQVPIDGEVISSEGCECNEAILTGESINIEKKQGDKMLAGSIIVAGAVELRTIKRANESYMYTMTEDLKLYKKSLSPIQSSILRFIQLMVLILAGLSVIILIRGALSGDSFRSAIIQIASVAATIIPEGLLLASTAFFVYGAIRIATKKVLLQQVNAIESLGRMSVVCIDKTGTLTENDPTYSQTLLYLDNPESKKLGILVNTYLTSETAPTTTTKSLLAAFSSFKGLSVSEKLSFSSTRKYGAARIQKDSSIIVVGAGDNFLNLLSHEEKKWVIDNVSEYSNQAKRVLFIGMAKSGELNDIKSFKSLRVVGLVVLDNPLKQGVKKTISFLQERGVQVVVISGDNSKTVSAIAEQAGIIHGGKVVTGKALDMLDDQELVEVIYSRPIFARILPNQKERIVKACQSANHLTAMIGDGANDALAIKQADIGIAMFAGAPASRQIADAVLLNNSFSSVPDGVKLSDSLITTLEMIASLFFSRVWTGVLLVLGSTLLNINYPFSPRNITLLNLFIVAFPLALWTAWPRHRGRSIKEDSFLVRTLPFSVLNSIIISIFTLAAYAFAVSYAGLDTSASQMFAYISFFIMSIFTISIIPTALRVDKNIGQQLLIWLFYAIVALLVLFILNVTTLANFFSLEKLDNTTTLLAVLVGFIGAIVQQILASLGTGYILWSKIFRNKKNRIS